MTDNLTPQQLRDERADICAVLLRTSYIRKVAREKADKYTRSPLYPHLMDCWGILEEIEATLNEADHRGELQGQVVQIGAEAIRLRELLVQIVREIRLADLSPGLRHAIEQERARESEGAR